MLGHSVTRLGRVTSQDSSLEVADSNTRSGRAVTPNHDKAFVEFTCVVVDYFRTMLEPGGKGVDYCVGRVQRNAGLVCGGVANLIHLHERLHDGGAVVELVEILARHGVAVAITYGDRRPNGCGAVVVIVVRARGFEWCAGRIWLGDIIVALSIEVGV